MFIKIKIKAGPKKLPRCLLDPKHNWTARIMQATTVQVQMSLISIEKAKPLMPTKQTNLRVPKGIDDEIRSTRSTLTFY